MKQPRPRTPSELFALADRARSKPDPNEGALSADGFGFVVARQLESALYLAGGGKLVNLPRYDDVELAVGSALTLTQGWLRVGGHAEELFSATLFLVTPDGGQDLLQLYAGPSGLALGDGRQLDSQKLLPPAPFSERALDRALAYPNRVAAALDRALFEVRPTDFVQRDSLQIARQKGARRARSAGSRRDRARSASARSAFFRAGPR